MEMERKGVRIGERNGGMAEWSTGEGIGAVEARGRND